MNLTSDIHWPIVGNRLALSRLENDFLNDGLAHAYLFTGPRQIGKYSVARAFAKLLQCTEGGVCQHCSVCKHIENRSHLDTLCINAPDTSIKIEEIREVISYLSISRQSNYKIVILKDIERMTIEAANALLKTLEEPVSNVIIIMTTTQIHTILPTLISRSRIVPFQVLSDQQLVEYLSQTYPGLEAQQLQKIVSFSMGKPGKAIQLLTDFELLQVYEKIYAHLEEFLSGAALYKKFAFVEEIGESETSLEIFFDVCAHILRNHLFVKMGYMHATPEASDISHSSEDLIQLTHQVVNAKQLLRQNINQKLLLENILLNF